LPDFGFNFVGAIDEFRVYDRALTLRRFNRYIYKGNMKKPLYTSILTNTYSIFGYQANTSAAILQILRYIKPDMEVDQ